MVTMAMILAAVGLPLFAGGSKEEVRCLESGTGPRISVTVEEGAEYLHKLKVLPLIRISSPPQLAVWTETPEGRFLETLYVTSRTGEQSWRSAPLDGTPSEEISRPEALPVWQHRAEGGSVDGRTAPTPKEGYRLLVDAPSEDVRIFVEVNHSTDFNERYPKDAAEGSPGYSGGPWGSGQPSLVYTALLDGSGGETPLELLGHGSPDGSDGEIRRTLEGITSAKEIVRAVRVVEVE
jgi:hypothetical protein